MNGHILDTLECIGKLRWIAWSTNGRGDNSQQFIKLSNVLPYVVPTQSKYCCLLISTIILYYQKVATLPLFVTEKTQTKAFTMIYKQKVVLPLFVTFPFSRSPKMTLSLSNIFPRRNDGNSIYTNRILMECLRNKDSLRTWICFLKLIATFATLIISSW